MDINERIREEVLLNNNTLELYYDDTTIVYDTIIIPSPVETLVSDFICSTLILPPTLKVIDLQFEEEIILTCMLPKLQYVKMINIHWPPDKSLSMLFNQHYYYYVDCTIDKKPLSEIVSEKYKKYFNKPLNFKKNTINQRIVGKKIDEILNYENMLEKCKLRSELMREELVQLAFHPVFIAKWFAAGLHVFDI